MACLSDALEQAEDETVDLEAASAAGSTCVSGSASNVVSTSFEMNILKILAEIQAGGFGVTRRRSDLALAQRRLEAQLAVPATTSSAT